MPHLNASRRPVRVGRKSSWRPGVFGPSQSTSVSSTHGIAASQRSFYGPLAATLPDAGRAVGTRAQEVAREGFSTLLLLPCNDVTATPSAELTRVARDNGVTIVDAWYLHGKTPHNAKPLERIARDIYLQWS